MYFRWAMRIRSLKTLRANYPELVTFLQDRIMDIEVDSTVSAKCSGLLKHMVSFKFLFYLTALIEIFDRIEVLNKELQATELSVIDSHRKVEAVTSSLSASRGLKFETVWQKSIDDAKKLEIEEPVVPRKRKVPKRLQFLMSHEHVFKSPKELYSSKFFEIFDQMIVSLKGRFDTESGHFFKFLESFAIGESSDVEKITDFYQNDFDKKRLISDRDLFLNLVEKSKKTVKNLNDIVKFLHENVCVRDLSQNL